MKGFKDNFAKSVGYDSWSDVKKAFREGEISHVKFGELENGLLQLYAMECLKKASERACVKREYVSSEEAYWTGRSTSEYSDVVDKKSIHNENNLV